MATAATIGTGLDADMIGSIAAVAAAVIGALVGAIGVRSRFSKSTSGVADDKAAVTRSDAVGEYFDTALNRSEQQRAEWERSARDAWTREKTLNEQLSAAQRDVGELRLRLDHKRAERALLLRLVHRYPDIAHEFDSTRPGDLGAPIDPRPTPRKD